MNASSQNAGTQTLTVSAASTLAASFTFNPASPSAGQAVQFSDTSTGGPTSWSWTFGDGATSTAQNPSHTYATAGSRTVTLTATNGSGSSNVSKTVTVAVALAASFNFSPASPAAGQAVQFTDTSTGSPTSWSWTFGDGATSTAQNPSHTYATAGSRTVALTATNGSGSTSVSKTVTVTAGLTASFTFGPSSPTAGQAVQFTDTSTGSPTSWSWDFNDGTTSTAQNPSHAFSTAGSYSVTLVAANSSTSKSVTQVVAVASASTLTASFRFSPASPTPNQAVQFTDTSSGSPVSWSWNFGDGASSAVQNPSHAYASVGSKTVTLTVTGSSGSSSASQTISVATESTIIPADRRIDWTYCGVPGGIPARTTISTTLNPGATASQINAAIAACPSGQVVYLSAGTYNNMGAIHFASKSGVTLRGAGAGQTIINSNVAGGGSYCIDSDYWGFSGATAISSGYVKGSTSLTMSATPTNFAVGKLIMIYQDDDITLVMGTDGPQTGINSNLKTIHRITNKVGSVLTIEPPLPYTLTAGLHPSAMYCAGTPTTLCGIEDLTLNAQAANYASILWANADRCWVKGVECYNADNIFVFPYEALQFEMRRSYCHFSGNFPNSQEGYGVYLYAASTYCRVEDNIFYQLIAGMLQSMSSCNAFLYNYGWQSCFLNQPYQFCMIDCNHGPHTMMCLWEGNMAEQFQNDGYHGSGSHQTLFRNWFHGLHPVWTDNRKMIDLCRAAYYHNIVGNVLGASSWTPANYEAGVGATNTIYRFGFPNMTNESTSPEVPWSSAYGLSYPDARVKSTLLRHGNYDYFNKAAVWDPNISDHSLPASLLYTSKPSYFGSLQWPPIGPDVPGFVTNIPAKARWDAYQASGNKSDLF
jgi:PKD repeat protein